jgi:hypothetical protein
MNMHGDAWICMDMRGYVTEYMDMHAYA